MTEHTPTPWRVGANSFGAQFIYGNPDQPRTSPMGVVYNDLIAGGDDPMRLTEANAAFIVKAVNNHVDLLRALTEMVQAFEPFTSKPMGAPGSDARNQQQLQIAAHRNAREALARLHAAVGQTRGDGS